MPDEKGGTAAPAKATKVKGKVYYQVGVTSPDGANRTFSTLSVHPRLFDTFINKVATIEGRQPVTANGHGNVLPDGALALSLREAIAQWAGYPFSTPNDLSLPLRGKGKAGTGKQAQAVKAKTLGVVRQVFASIRGAMPEPQALELARKIATENSAQLSDDEIASLWAETA